MSKSRILIAALSAAALSYIPLSQAESLVDGEYLSEGDVNGKGVCTLVVKSITEGRKYGDESFELESSGDGACEWSAIGLSKSYAITGGMVTSGGSPAFLRLTFPFGPAGNKLEMTAYDLDGSIRVNEVFAKQ
jgi:hypothetical protein